MAETFEAPEPGAEEKVWQESDLRDMDGGRGSRSDRSALPDGLQAPIRTDASGKGAGNTGPKVRLCFA